MKNNSSLTVLFLLLFWLSSCGFEKNPNKNTFSQKVINNNQIDGEIPSSYSYVDSVYVPIYSDIYSKSKDLRFLLTATLSIRNTSYTDTLVVSTIDYFDTTGELVKKYIETPIFLKPMASIDYVIDEEDDSGGSGANFIVIWTSQSQNVTPVIQSVMLSTNGQQGIAFTTEGVSISGQK